MDTFKDRQQLEDLYNRGDAPWEVCAAPSASGKQLPGSSGKLPGRRPEKKCSTMLNLSLNKPAGAGLNILCLGAHADDIEIGCGGTVLSLLARHENAAVRWIVFSASEERAREARASADAFLSEARSREIVVRGHRDGFFPYLGGRIKEDFEEIKATSSRM